MARMHNVDPEPEWTERLAMLEQRLKEVTWLIQLEQQGSGEQMAARPPAGEVEPWWMEPDDVGPGGLQGVGDKSHM